MNTILKAILINIILIGYVYAGTPDPLQKILDRLEGIEDRLTEIEKTKVATTPAAITTPKNATVKKVTVKTKPSNPISYKEGLIVNIKPVRNEQELTSPSLDTIDAFVWDTNSKITSALLKDEKITTSGTVGFDITGYLKIEKEGLYTIRVAQQHKQIGFGDRFDVHGWIEDNQFIKANGQSDKNQNHTSVGSMNLEKGIYKLHIWISYLNSFNKNMLKTIDVKIKKPGDLKFSSIKKMTYHKSK